MATPICPSFETRLNSLIQLVDVRIAENQVTSGDSTDRAQNRADSLIYWTSVKTHLEATYAL